jgi:hypothetical protein
MRVFNEEMYFHFIGEVFLYSFLWIFRLYIWLHMRVSWSISKRRDVATRRNLVDPIQSRFSLVLMLCNHRQDTYWLSYFGAWPWTNHGFTYDLFCFNVVLCSLGQATFIDYLIALLDCGRANHFTCSCYAALGKTLLIDRTMGLMQIRYMCSGLCLPRYLQWRLPCLFISLHVNSETKD